MRKSILATFIATAFLSLNAHASDLMQVYKEALANDAQFGAARAARLAGAERTVQGRAGLLPGVKATAGVTRSHTEIDPDFGKSVSGSSTTKGLSVSMSQTLFDLGAWETYEQGKLSSIASEIQFAQAQQDLMLRVAQAYFDVLATENTLKTLQDQKVATAEQLASAKRNFEVGTQTITDTHEAQSAYDLVTAQVLAGEGDLEVKRAALRQIIGKDAGNLSRLKDGVQLSAPVPSQINEWVSTAEKQNYGVTGSQISLEIAQREIKKSRAGHLPTVDLTASTARNNGPLATGGNGISKPSTIGVSVTIPIFKGFSTDSRVRETIALEDKARNDLENARRTAAQGARQAYIGVVSGLAQIKAFEAAEISSQSALDSTKLGYQVGVRINIDVLNAQQKLSNTRQSLAKARYDNIVNGLRLKAAAGTLKEADLAEVNTFLVQ